MSTKYKVFDEGGLHALVNQMKTNKKTATDNSVAVDGLEKDFQAMTGQLTEVLGEVDSCLSELDETKADITAVNNSLAKKVDIITGKGLSTNDFTTTEKNKLAGIEDEANNYTHPSTHPASMIEGLAEVAKSGKYSDLSDTPTIPTKTSQLTNDSGFKTTDNNTTYELSKSGDTIILTGSDGTTTSVTDSDSTYSNATLGQGYGTCSTAAATAAKDVTLSSYSLSTGGVVSVKFTNAVPANATMNINSKGAKNIYYRGSKITAGIIEAGDIATFIYDGTQYHVLTVDRHRFFSLLLPYGVSIEASESSPTDINAVQYLKVGNYYCSSNAKAKYVSDLPKTGTAFMMTVSSPLSTAIDNETTKTWVYRLRRLQYYTGEEYVQYCYAGATAGTWTYGEWKKVVYSDEITELEKTITQLTNRIAALEASIGFVATEADM